MAGRYWRRAFEPVRGFASRKKNHRRMEPMTATPGLLALIFRSVPWIVALVGIAAAAGLFRQAPGAALNVVVFLAGLCALYLKMVFSQRERMERIVRERTAELRIHEQHLEEMVSERTESLSRKSAFLEALLNSSAYGTIVLDTLNRRTFQNPRAVELLRIPQAVADSSDHEAQVRHFLSIAKHPEKLEKTIRHLDTHPDEGIHDEVELLDGTVLERYSSPVFGDEGKRYGRVLTFRDITERKRAIEALHESEELYRVAVENSSDGIALIRQGRQFFVNRRYLEIFGYEREEDAMNCEAFTHVHPDDRDRVREMSRRREKGEAVPRRYECKGVRQDGAQLEIEISVAPVLLHGHDVFLIHFRDITKRKAAERALRESENKFRDLAEKSVVGIYLIQDNVFKYVNPRFAEIHGYTPEEFIGKGMAETLLPDDMPGVCERIRKRMSGEVDLAGDEFRIVTKQGLIKDVETYGSHTTYRGRRAIIGTLLDVTERKQTEAMLNWKTAFLEAQVNTSLDGILVIDGQGKRVLQNQRAVDMWKIPLQILDEQGGPDQFEHMAGMAKQSRQFREKVDYLGRCPIETSRDEIELIDGAVIDTYSCPVLGENGEYYGRIWTFRDITELRRYWDMLENLSTTDGLTDLPNRRRFDDFLSREWRRSMRDQSLLSLIVLDIDFFKEFNDHYGHLAGDDCLRQVAAVLREVVHRPGDLAARYGGEEFACVLPDTDLSGAATLAYRIRDRMTDLNIPHFFSSVADRLTLSFGVAALTPGKGQSPSDLIRLADSLLYAAKEGGRNQVRSWQQPALGKRVNER
jgi:diguanylate cyclase (GGDEF)-like protein/PAS domain S-box-containing protein